MLAAHEICIDFMKHVVGTHVFSDAERLRGSGPLGDEQQRKVAAGQVQDSRTPALLRQSGKGGWSADPKRAAAYAPYTNVTLLDHLMSVLRGALVFAEMDLAAGCDGAALRRRLAVVAALAFLHDADKMLGLDRRDARTALDAAAMEGLMARFGIDPFLARHGAPVSAATMLTLVNCVEVTSAHALVKLPAEHWHDRIYVRLADRLDGAFLLTRPLEGRGGFGVAGALALLAEFAALDTRVVAGTAWRTITLQDPHTPFLLDALQAALSAECRDRHRVPPLIELNHDGRLLVMVPEAGSDAMVAAALGRVTGQLGARIRVGTNNRGAISLLEAPGEVADLRASVSDMVARDRAQVLRVGIDALRVHGGAIDAFLMPSGFLPRHPDLPGYPGRLVPLWLDTADDDDGGRATHRDAVVIAAVLCCAEPPKALRIPDAAVRETELRVLLVSRGAVVDWPAFLDTLPDDTRRVLLAGFAAGCAQQDPALWEALLGPAGLVALWLEGRDGRRGISDSIDRSALRLRDAVVAHYTALLSGQLVVAADEAAEGRCHFTNMPVPRSARIDGRTGLYGVNVSAFSGREGRPESFSSSVSETLVSPVAEAEHRLRRLQFEATGRVADKRKVPVAVTSPTCAGLFGALAYRNDADSEEFALSDLVRTKIEDGRIQFQDADARLRRTRVARFEELPGGMESNGKEPGRIAFFRMVLTAARRTGRPIHVFRGLPRPRPEFVAFDFMPAPLVSLLGGDGFRVEQMEPAIQSLRGMEDVASATGFGLGLALQLCDPATRFGAACDALARAERRMAAASTDLKLPNIVAFANSLLETEPMPSPSDTALLDFGQAMARVQRIPLRTDGANVAELGLRTALDTVESLERMGQAAPESLVAGIAGELEKTMARSGLFVRSGFRAGRTMDEVLETAARTFVEAVWAGAFGSALPSSRDRRVALAVYRHAFKSASRRLYAQAGVAPGEDTEPAAPGDQAE